MIGKTFERLTVIEDAGRRKGNRHWRCSCSCGGEAVVKEWSLTAGRSRSCGCLRTELLQANRVHATHPYVGTPEYKEWLRMKERCYWPSNRAFKKYGGSGVIVCERWKGSFLAFLEDVGSKPSRLHAIVRNGDAGDFSPENAGWQLKRTRQRQELLKALQSSDAE